MNLLNCVDSGRPHSPVCLPRRTRRHSASLDSSIPLLLARKPYWLEGFTYKSGLLGFTESQLVISTPSHNGDDPSLIGHPGSRIDGSLGRLVSFRRLTLASRPRGICDPVGSGCLKVRRKLRFLSTNTRLRSQSASLFKLSGHRLSHSVPYFLPYNLSSKFGRNDRVLGPGEARWSDDRLWPPPVPSNPPRPATARDMAPRRWPGKDPRAKASTLCSEESSHGALTRDWDDKKPPPLQRSRIGTPTWDRASPRCIHANQIPTRGHSLSRLFASLHSH